eukprot:1041383-Rhodomonas_salina.1
MSNPPPALSERKKLIGISNWSRVRRWSEGSFTLSTLELRQKEERKKGVGEGRAAEGAGPLSFSSSLSLLSLFLSPSRRNESAMRSRMSPS